MSRVGTTAAAFFAGTFALLSFAPAALHARTARAAARTSSTPAVGHGIVQQTPPLPARSPSLDELEHIGPSLTADPDLESPDAEGEAGSVTSRAPVSAASSAPIKPATAARNTTTPASAKEAALDVDGLKRTLGLRIDSLPICHRGGGPEGEGLAEVTFSGDGRARVALSAPYANTEVGACVARRLGTAAQTFDGPPITLKVRFTL